MRIIALLSVFALHAVAQDRTVSRVVSLLDTMLKKSKEDGKEDRTIFAKFKCYCDTNQEEKATAIANHEMNIETMEATVADRTAQNELLSGEVAKLRVNMAANAHARAIASHQRDTEHADFLSSEADMETAINAVSTSMDLLNTLDAAVPASFLQLNGGRKFSDKQIKALRASSAYLNKSQRVHVNALIEGKATKDSGGIAGVLQTFENTFVANLDNARTTEANSLTTFEDLEGVQTEEWNKMDEAKSAKETIIGEHDAEIATTNEELATTRQTKLDDENFVSDLTNRCAVKTTQYEKRNHLRANEDAAIAQAIAILNSDAAFSTFGNSASTSSGATSAFVQLSSEHQSKMETVVSKLRNAAIRSHSVRLANVAASLGSASSKNAFVKILENIRKMITRIDREEQDDSNKLSWCDTEQTGSEENQGQKETDIGTLTQTISDAEVSATDSRNSIKDAQESHDANVASQKAETESRDAAHALHVKNVQNLEAAEAILTKATEVLTKYYDWLHAKNAPHHYVEHSQVDFSGSDIIRMAGASQEELEEACTMQAECVGFTTNGWLRSAIAPEDEWFTASDSLFVKTFDETAGHVVLLEKVTMSGRIQKQEPGENDGHTAMDDEPESFGAAEDGRSDGQAESGAEVLEMLRFILSEATKERELAITDEAASLATYDGLMETLVSEQRTLEVSITTLEGALATTLKSLEEANEDKTKTEAEHAAITKYLEGIEPGCTFMQENYDTRTANRAAEKTSLEGAIELLENSPEFQ